MICWCLPVGAWPERGGTGGVWRMMVSLQDDSRTVTSSSRIRRGAWRRREENMSLRNMNVNINNLGPSILYLLFWDNNDPTLIQLIKFLIWFQQHLTFWNYSGIERPFYYVHGEIQAYKLIWKILAWEKEFLMRGANFRGEFFQTLSLHFLFHATLLFSPQ